MSTNSYVLSSEAFLQREGIHPVSRNDAASINIPLHEVPDNILGDIYKKQSSYVGWVFYCRTRRNEDLERAKVLLKRRRSQRYLESIESNPKMKIKELDMMLDLELAGYEDEIAQIQCDVNILDSILKDAEAMATVISREITLRTAGTTLRRNSF